MNQIIIVFKVTEMELSQLLFIVSKYHTLEYLIDFAPVELRLNRRCDNASKFIDEANKIIDISIDNFDPDVVIFTTEEKRWNKAI